MLTHEVMVKLSPIVYQRIVEQAAQSNRSVEAELAVIVEEATQPDDKLSSELEILLQQMEGLSIGQLWRIARSPMPAKKSKPIHSLHQKRHASELNEVETKELADLMQEVNRTFVTKNRAIGILREKGEDISEFAPNQSQLTQFDIR
jgi:hypothetical protein